MLARTIVSTILGLSLPLRCNSRNDKTSSAARSTHVTEQEVTAQLLADIQVLSEKDRRRGKAEKLKRFKSDGV